MRLENETMKVITAPEKYIEKPGDVRCFLAGGISNCPEWQQEAIKYLREFDVDKNHPNNELIIFNPRRESFPINNPDVTEEQIAWEFEALNNCGIFSMYFCNADSDQPICMYELGRYLLHTMNRYWHSWEKRIVISVEDGYRRQADVKTQVRLATKNDLIVANGATPKSHAEYIAAAYESIFERINY